MRGWAREKELLEDSLLGSLPFPGERQGQIRTPNWERSGKMGKIPATSLINKYFLKSRKQQGLQTVYTGNYREIYETIG